MLGADEFKPEPKLSIPDQVAWDLYCEDSAGAMHQLDHPGQMTPDMWAHYRAKATSLTGKFKVEHLFSYGWDDAQWLEDDKPMRFDTREEAQDEINDHVASAYVAAANGDLEGIYTQDHYRVVRA